MDIKQILHFFLIASLLDVLMRQQNVFSYILHEEQKGNTKFQSKEKHMYSLFVWSLLPPHIIAGDLTVVNTQFSQNFIAKCFTEWFLTAKFVRFS